MICQLAGIPLLLHSSVKAGLDVNRSDPEEKEQALEKLVGQVTSLHDWIEKQQLALEEPIRPYIEAVAQVHKQDLEEDAQGVRIRQGVAEDRRVSIEDSQMRHGRKSKSKRFNGYKQHIAADLDTGLIAACAVTPANRPEEEAMPEIRRTSAGKSESLGGWPLIGLTSTARWFQKSSLAAERSWRNHGRHGTFAATYSPRPTSGSTCAAKRSPSPQARRKPSRLATWWNLTQNNAGPAPCVANAHSPRRAADEQYRLRRTSSFSIDCGSSKRAPRTASIYDNALVLSITSHTSPPAKGPRRGTRDAARTSSTSGARWPSRISRPTNE